MTTSSSPSEVPGGDSSGDGPRNVISVVWWRDLSPARQVQRSHRVGWSVLGDGRQGVMPLVSSHLRLDRATIERGLCEVLKAEFGVEVRVMPASDCVDQLDPATRLAVAGHTMSDADLASTFGLDIIGGVTAELLGRGLAARVVVEATLSAPIRHAVLNWAEAAIDQFVHCDSDELRDNGWQQLTPTRWQLLAVQAT